MPMIRNNHSARARFEQEMADLSASNIERIIHTKLADLRWAAGHARPAEPVTDGAAA